MLWNAKNGQVAVGDGKMSYVSFGRGGKAFVILPGLSYGLTTVKGKALKGTFCTVDGNGKAVDKPQDICGKRNPPVGPAPDFAAAVYGQPINLLAGTIDDFEIMGTDKINGWTWP